MTGRAILLLGMFLSLPLSAATGQGRGGDRGQDRNGRFREPAFWISGGWGVQWGYTVSDGRSNATWAFNEGYPVRLSLEKSIGGGQSVGVAFSNGSLPLKYFGTGSNSCRSCDAHATMSTLALVLHNGGRGRRGGGIATIYDITIGATQFSRFTNDAGGAALQPTEKNVDFMFGVGGGVGYAFAPDWVVELVHEYTYGFHERANLPGNAPGTYRHNRTRLGLRVGF